MKSSPIINSGVHRLHCDAEKNGSKLFATTFAIFFYRFRQFLHRNKQKWIANLAVSTFKTEWFPDPVSIFQSPDPVSLLFHWFF